MIIYFSIRTVIMMGRDGYSSHRYDIRVTLKIVVHVFFGVIVVLFGGGTGHFPEIIIQLEITLRPPENR